MAAPLSSQHRVALWLALAATTWMVGCAPEGEDPPACESDLQCAELHRALDPDANPPGCLRYACAEGSCVLDEAERADCFDNDCDGVVDEGAVGLAPDTEVRFATPLEADSLALGPELALVSGGQLVRADVPLPGDRTERATELELSPGCTIFTPAEAASYELAPCAPSQIVGGGRAGALAAFVDAEGVPRVGQLAAGELVLGADAESSNTLLGVALAGETGGRPAVHPEICARGASECGVESLSIASVSDGAGSQHGALTVVIDENGTAEVGVVGLHATAAGGLYAADEGVPLALGPTSRARTATLAEPTGDGFLVLSITALPAAVRLARVGLVHAEGLDGLMSDEVYFSGDELSCAMEPALFAASSECGNAIGQCGAGEVLCVDGSVLCTELRGTEERCANGLDDDCDGLLDEEGCAACAGTDEVCNGVDDDCDGLVDEEVPGTGQPCGGEDACELGTLRCRGGVEVCEGVRRPLLDPTGVAYENTETALDDDCDGATVANVECVPAGPLDDDCDGRDDDCDGATDEDMVRAELSAELAPALLTPSDRRACAPVAALGEPEIDVITSASATVSKEAVMGAVDHGEAGDYRRLGFVWIERGPPGGRLVFRRARLARCLDASCLEAERVAAELEEPFELNSGAGRMEVLGVSYVETGFSRDAQGRSHGGFHVLYRADGETWLARVDGVSGALVDDGCVEGGAGACGVRMSALDDADLVTLGVSGGRSRYVTIGAEDGVDTLRGGVLQAGCTPRE